MDNNFCSASVTSETYAIKAQRALQSRGIYSTIVRLDGEKSLMGCSYAVEFPCYALDMVKHTLSENRVRVRQFYKGDTKI